MGIGIEKLAHILINVFYLININSMDGRKVNYIVNFLYFLNQKLIPTTFLNVGNFDR